MKKLVLTLIAIAGIFTALKAQDPVANGGFENWNSAGAYEEPNGWGTINIVSSVVPGAPVTCEKSTDSHTGQHAIKLTTTASPADLSQILGVSYQYDTLPGMLFSNSLLGGSPAFPYTQRPVNASFFVKYSPVNGDSAIILVQLTKYTGGQTVIVGASTGIIKTAVTNWSYLELPIQYQTNDTPDSLLVIAMSSAYGLKALSAQFASLPIVAPQPGTTLFLDDFSLLTTGLNEQGPAKLNFAVYPNPASTDLTLATTGYQFGNSSLKVEMYDMTGRLVKTINVESALQKVNITELSSGMYVYSLKDGQNVLRTGKLSVTK